MTQHTAEDIAEEIRDLFACNIDYCSGVDIKKITDSKFAVPILLDNGQSFGIIVEKIK